MAPVSSAARACGLSHSTFYKAQADYERAGLCGLLPAKRGPRRAHKLSEPVMKFVTSELAADSSLRAPELVRRIKEQLGLDVHPRSVERALQRGKNAVDRSDEKAAFLEGADTNRLTVLYEDLRRWALDSAFETPQWPRHLGWGVLLRRGMKEWLAT